MTVIQKKICLLGDFAVGKTSLVRRFVEGRFDERYLSTIGVKISRKPLTRPYGTLNLLVWDLADSEEVGAESSYIRGASGALIVCDLTRRDTLSGLEHYAAQLRQLNPKAVTVFVGNKADLIETRAISDEDLQALSAKLNSPCFLSSAKTGENVENAFLNLAERIEAEP